MAGVGGVPVALDQFSELVGIRHLLGFDVGVAHEQQAGHVEVDGLVDDQPVVAVAGAAVALVAEQLRRAGQVDDAVVLVDGGVKVGAVVGDQGGVGPGHNQQRQQPPAQPDGQQAADAQQLRPRAARPRPGRRPRAGDDRFGKCVLSFHGAPHRSLGPGRGASWSAPLRLLAKLKPGTTWYIYHGTLTNGLTRSGKYGCATNQETIRGKLAHFKEYGFAVDYAKGDQTNAR